MKKNASHKKDENINIRELQIEFYEIKDSILISQDLHRRYIILSLRVVFISIISIKIVRINIVTCVNT